MLHPILREINQMNILDRDGLEELFEKDGLKLLDHAQLYTFEPRKRFVTVGDALTKIWILLSGKVKAMEEYPTGEVYVFQKFFSPQVFGEMELLSELGQYKATLITEEKSVFLTLPARAYLGFLESNPQFLLKRTKSILNQALQEQTNYRVYLQLSASERIKLYFIHQYELTVENGICILNLSRQQIADETSYSVKTINRVMKVLERDNFVTLQGHKIVITQKQYESLLVSLNSILNN